MKRWILIGAAAGALSILAVVVMLALGIAGFTVARAQTSTGPGMMGWRGHMGGMMGGRGMMGSGYGPMHPYMVGAFADQLGLSSEELQAELKEGRTMWQVAEDQGFSQEEIQEMMQAAHTLALENAVEAGALTQEQADWMRQRWEQMQDYGIGPGHCPGMGGSWEGNNRRGPGWRWNSPSNDG